MPLTLYKTFVWQKFASLCLFTCLVYVCTYCVPIAHLRENKPFPLLYLGHAQITSNILTTKKDQITRGDNESLTRRIQSLLLENLVLGKKSNQQTKKMRTKTNYKPKANDKRKENNAVFFETWPSSV